MQPSVFVSHGAPTLALDDSPSGRFLDGYFAGRPKPRAVLVVSAHDTARMVRVGAAEAPSTVHDFGGFPEPLYRLRYPAPGDPTLAAEALRLLAAAGIPAQADAAHGFDHGVWVPLLRMLPAADVPVVTVSVDPARDAAHHLGLGRALRSLRHSEVLLLGSGGFVHNLSDLAWHSPHAPRSAWAVEFADWMTATLERGDHAALLEWRARAPHAARAHPTIEHLMPLFFSLGACFENERLRVMHHDTEFASLAMEAFSS